MAFSYNQYNLGKLEAFLKELGWQIRYEKGNFQSGSCIVREKQIIVVNKFVPLEQKIHALIEIIFNLDLKDEELKSQNTSFLNELKKIKLAS